MVKNIKSESKICPICKRPFANRKKWKSRNSWEEIVYCSDKCRKNKRATPKGSSRARS